MKKIKIDGKTIDKKEDLFKVFKNELDLIELNAFNLDALWDVLYSYDQKIEIILENEESLFKKFNSYSEDFISLLEDLTIENNNIHFKIII